jgi:hypothetical protein
MEEKIAAPASAFLGLKNAPLFTYNYRFGKNAIYD